MVEVVPSAPSAMVDVAPSAPRWRRWPRCHLLAVDGCAICSALMVVGGDG